MNPNENTPAPSTAELQTNLALIRTSAALDRTLLAWVRTSLSLICFGFTLAKVLHDLIIGGQLHAAGIQSPRMIGIGMMVIGVIGLLGGAAEHIRIAKRLGSAETGPIWSTALVVTLLLAVVGILMIHNLVANLID